MVIPKTCLDGFKKNAIIIILDKLYRLAHWRKCHQVAFFEPVTQQYREKSSFEVSVRSVLFSNNSKLFFLEFLNSDLFAFQVLLYCLLLVNEMYVFAPTWSNTNESPLWKPSISNNLYYGVDLRFGDSELHPGVVPPWYPFPTSWRTSKNKTKNRAGTKEGKNGPVPILLSRFQTNIISGSSSAINSANRFNKSISQK